MEFYDDENIFWRIKKAVYGLKTSPTDWQEHFAKTMNELGWTRSRTDANLFTKKIGDEVIMVLVYVDDLFILGPDEIVRSTIESLRSYFVVKETGSLIEGSEVQFLERTIRRDLDSIYVSTSSNYVKALTELLDIDDKRDIRTTGTSSPTMKPDDADALDKLDHSKYRRAVGMLQWIVPTRPDLAFATKERARALAAPTNADMLALKHLVRYYRTTVEYELRLHPKTRTRVPGGEP